MRWENVRQLLWSPALAGLVLCAGAWARADDAPEAVALRHVHSMLKAVREKVLAEAEYVGPRFAEDARRIHFEEAPDRGIYGEATREDVISLAEDGIDVTPLPPLPDDLS